MQGRKGCGDRENDGYIFLIEEATCGVDLQLMLLYGHEDMYRYRYGTTGTGTQTRD